MKAYLKTSARKEQLFLVACDALVVLMVFCGSYLFRIVVYEGEDVSLLLDRMSGLVPLAVKFTSKGPVLFTQERLGMNEKPFTLIKFRTMVQDAEKECGPKWSSQSDPRITPVGRFLRKTRMDELPQLINILKGDMSFVGPRPIRRYFADLLSREFPFYRLRFTVRPGITGWAQVKGDYAGSKEGQLEKLEYELFYIQNRSSFFDLFIILKTIQTVLFRPGQ